MKRYFCDTCKRYQRSQKWPADIVMSDNIRMRTATCDWHSIRDRRPKKKVRRLEPKRVVSFEVNKKHAKKSSHKGA